MFVQDLYDVDVGHIEGECIMPDETDRWAVLCEVRTHEFTHAMHAHQCPGQEAYEVTELMIWLDIGVDLAYRWRLN